MMNQESDHDPRAEEVRHRLSAGARVAAWATGITLFLAAVKAGVAHLRGSPALMADAVHSGADTVAILASWIGLKLAARPSTKRFPFGLFRVETLASLIVSVVIAAAGVELLLEAIRGMIAGRPPTHHSLDVLAVALGSAVISFGIFLWEARVGRRLQSQSLLANADESRSDVLSSIAVFVGAAATYFSVPYLEQLVAFGLALLIFWLGIKHGRIALYALLDASLDRELEEEVAALAAAMPGVMGVEKVRLRRSGPVRFGIAHIQVRKSTDVTQGHELAHRVVEKVREQLPQIEMLTVHLEPFHPETEVVAVPAQDADVDAGVSAHFGRACCFAIAKVSHSNVQTERFVENTARDKPARAGLAAVKDIMRAHHVDVVLTAEIGEIAFHILRDHHIEVFAAPQTSIRDALERFAAGELSTLVQPTHSSEAAGPGPSAKEGNS